MASHAQKYFLRQTNPNKKKRRSSLFDMMATDMVLYLLLTYSTLHWHLNIIMFLINPWYTCELQSPAPNCPVLPPSMGKLHDMVAMTKQLQNSSLVSSFDIHFNELVSVLRYMATYFQEGVSSSSTVNLAPQVARDLPPPIPSFKATNVDSSLSKMNHMVMLLVFIFDILDIRYLIL